ncbi:CheY-like chemotaxis protein [Bradyrhizobium sp. F1.13.1]
MRLLVVEDDPLIREFVVEDLREEGYEVIHAANGEDGGRRVADVLVTDVRQPGRVDGWQIAERCREQDPELPVIYSEWLLTRGAGPGIRQSVPLNHDPADVVRAVKIMTR